MGACVLTVLLRGTSGELDRLLGKLLWLSNTLVLRGQKHRVAVLSGRGLEQFKVSDSDALYNMMDSVLSAPQAAPDAVLPAMDEQVFAVEGGHG